MPYTIIKTDGTVLTDILDNSVDKVSTDLTLVGKSTQNYGLEFNQNFVKLLENFASTTEPIAPITGQIWYDTSEEKIRIFNGSVFKEPNRPQIGNIEPVLSPGDLWIDSARRQLYFNDGQGTRLAGPIYTAQQGTSGYEVVDLKDTADATKTIVKLKIGNTLLGVFSKESFTPNYNNTAGNILLNEGITGTLIKGFTPVGTDVKFYITAKNAENLVDSQGNPVNISNFVQTNRDNFLIGTMNISSSTPLVLGPSNNTSIQYTGPTTFIKNNVQNGNFVIQVTDPTTTNNAIFIKASQSRVGVFESNPLSTLDINGDINVRGNIVSNNSSIDIANVGVTTINIGNQTTNIAIGSISGTTTIKSDLRASKNIKADGGAITSTQASFNMLNTGVNTINLGGEASNINIGGSSGTVNFNNNVLINRKLTLSGTSSEIQVKSVNIKDNIVTSTGSAALSNLILSSYNGRVEFNVDTQATENLILKKKLEFDVAGEAEFTNINAGGAYFRFLPVNVRNLYIGQEATLVTIGALTGTTYINNNLNVSGNINVGYDEVTPSTIDSNSAITYLHNTNATTIYFGGNATNITTGANNSGTFYIRNASTVAEGDIVIKGGDLRTTNTSASLFNQVATSIAIGKSASNIEIGNDAGSTTLNNRLIINGSITINGRGNNYKGTIAVGQSTTELDLFPTYLSTLTVAPTASLIYIGKAYDSVNNESGGTVTMQYDLRVINDFIIPHVDTNAGGLGGAGLLYKNDTNRMVSSDLVRTFGSSRALGVTGDIYYSGKLTGPDSIAIIENAKITKELIISGTSPVSGTLGPTNPAVGIISSTNTTVNVFNSNVTTLNLGGAGNETINLGSSTSKIKVLGNFIPKWKTLNSNYEAVAGDRLLINAGTNNVTVTLPATPTIGDEIRFIDQVGLGTYSLIISRNGNLINAAANNLTINAAGKAFCLVYTGNARGWVYDNA
jgi:hypothetical protein